MSDIFISYSREDRDRAERVARALEAHGWAVWWDRAVPTGRTFDEVIEEAIDASRCVVVLWSETSVSSRWVRTEAQEGLERDVLVPILIDDVRIPLAFRRVQAANLVTWDGTKSSPAFQSLIADVEALTGLSRAVGKPEPDQAPVALGEAPPQHIQGKTKSEDRREDPKAEAPVTPSPTRPALSLPTPRRSLGSWHERAWVKSGAVGVIGIVAVVTGWQFWPRPDPSPVSPVPSIQDFQADVTSITEGDEVTLTWRTTDADRVVLEPGGPVGLNDSVAVSPRAGTTYMLVASGPVGADTSLVEIFVAPEPEAPTATLSASLVRITGTDRPGSGIVIGLDANGATVLTAMHVIQGGLPFQVAFAVAPSQLFSVVPTDVTGMQQDEINGLAVFRVGGAVPAAVSAATLDDEMDFDIGDPELLSAWGYPNRARTVRSIQGVLSGFEGIQLVMSPGVGEGMSGGPVFRQNRVVGVVTSSDQNFTYAVRADVAAITLRGWR